MRVGVYIDGYNLYYGGRGLCGKSTAGWRWLDLRTLCSTIVGHRRDWPDAVVSRVIYCTARIDSRSNPDGYRDQDIYLKALVERGSVDHIEYGNYVARTKKALLAGALGGEATEGVGRHWWYRLTADDLRSSQLLPTVGSYLRPTGW